MEEQPSEKKPYKRPELKNYGRIERLTTGGSGPEVEATVDNMGMLTMEMNKNKFP